MCGFSEKLELSLKVNNTLHTKALNSALANQLFEKHMSCKTTLHSDHKFQCFQQKTGSHLWQFFLHNRPTNRQTKCSLTSIYPLQKRFIFLNLAEMQSCMPFLYLSHFVELLYNCPLLQCLYGWLLPSLRLTFSLWMLKGPEPHPLQVMYDVDPKPCHVSLFLLTKFYNPTFLFPFWGT